MISPVKNPNDGANLDIPVVGIYIQMAVKAQIMKKVLDHDSISVLMILRVRKVIIHPLTDILITASKWDTSQPLK